jgi:sugar (pentulose or hexulose) kinase
VTRRCLMGLDLGGGGVRCLLLPLEGGEPIVAARAWASFGGAGVDLDLEALFARVAEAARAALAEAGGAVEVAGLAATAVRFGAVVLDRAGRALLAASNRDSRAALEALALAGEAGEELQRRTGHWPLPIGLAAKLRALAKEGRLGAAHAVLSLDGWLAWRLSGERASDFSQAGVTGLWNVAAAAWDEAALARCSASAALLPRVCEAGTQLGALRADAAEALGVPAGLSVAAGGGDTQCALLGMGVLEPGAAGAVCGTTLPLQQVIAEPRGDAAGRCWLEPHLPRGRFVLESNAGTAGEALEWLGRLLFPGARAGAARLLAEASDVAPGAGGLLSAFGAQLFDARAMTFPVGDLALSHLVGSAEESRARVARAAVEGAAYGVRANLEQLRAAAGAAPLRVGAGLSRSRVWVQVLADVLGEPVEAAACA